ncbi:hypothetical protein [Microbulbifer sp. TYP-18]|uniref:hypothetical protein n=1 Tax=Microbulbifer sp. TYP-18 TaxID=3230024 RepID=UPI0034C5C050
MKFEEFRRLLLEYGSSGKIGDAYVVDFGRKVKITFFVFRVLKQAGCLFQQPARVSPLLGIHFDFHYKKDG